MWNARFPGGDLLRYARGGYARQAAVHILILGETGAGKEVVARALAYGRYLPFSEATHAFVGRASEGLHVVNASAQPAALADSLFFGHKKGAFTGADKDTPGALARCADGEVLFLDEFGDLAPEVQIKLLRVVEDGKYTPLGATEERRLGGTLVFAAQPGAFRGRSFRQDMRHRLYAHVIRLPSLRARIDSDPAELTFLVHLFAREVTGSATEAERLTTAVMHIIEEKYRAYAWSGNLRELKGCVTNVYEQLEYEPASAAEEQPSVPPRAAPPAPRSPGEALARAVLEGKLCMDELRRRYIMHAFELKGTYTEAAKLLQMDWRTVRTTVKREQARPQASAPPPGAAAPPAKADGRSSL